MSDKKGFSGVAAEFLSDSTKEKVERNAVSEVKPVKKEKKTKKILFTMTESFYAELSAAAKKQELPLNSFISMVLKKELTKKEF